MEKHTSTYPVVDTNDLAKFVSENYSEKSQKTYLAVIQQVKTHGGGYLSTSDLGDGYVESFQTYLSGRLAPGSISQYLRSLLSSYLGPEYKAYVKHAFRNVGSKNESETRCITSADFFKLKADTGIAQHMPLAKTRELFILSTLLGGLPLEQIVASLDRMICKGSLTTKSGQNITLPEQAVDLIDRFKQQFDIPFSDYLSQLSADDYARRLDVLGAMLQLRHPLAPRSSADAWVAIARESGISPQIIAAGVNHEVALRKYVSADTIVSAEDLQWAYSIVADRIESTVRHWYAMRCYSTPADEISSRILGHIASGDISDCDIYQPQSEQIPDRVLQPILFFRTTSANALSLKRHLGGDVYIYSYRTGDKKPAIIANSEMMTFMLLANVAGDSIRLYFPEVDADTPLFEANDTVMITDGDFSGMVGIVEKTSSDTMRVVVRITGICAVATAEVPLKFLRGVGDNTK